MKSVRTSLTDDAGAALVTTMMVLVLMAGLTAGMTALVMSDNRVRAMDNTRTQAFYVAHAGLEQLTASLGDLFSVNFAPTGAQINALMATPPALGATWQEPDGTNGYRINFPVDGAGNPTAATMTVMAGPFQGLVGLATPYTMTATARLADQSEASLTRTLQTVAIPVFQFGIFSENDLSFFAGPNFNFGGRVHTNSNLYLAEGDGNTVTLADRVTTVGEIVRTNLSNGWDTNTNYQGTVSVLTAPGAFRNLARSEGSLVGTVGTARNEPTWTNLSTGAYNHNIASGNTGAKRLDLPITQFGAPIDLIKRPLQNENVANPSILAERFFSLASLRIFLSDTNADITNMPGVTAALPLSLAANPAGWVVGGTTPNIALSAAASGVVDSAGYGALTGAAGVPLLGGVIKIEMCNQNLLPAGVTTPSNACWQDVTLQVLQLGVAASQDNIAGCAQPSPDAILRIQRYRDDPTCWETNNAPHTTNALRRAATAFSPMVLYDPREAEQRDVFPAAMQLGGIMHYIELDANNLARWFRGQIPAANCPIACTGANALNANGYTVYFSDRRGNRDLAGAETGEYGFEDSISPAVTVWAKNNVLDAGEDFNGDGQLAVYGETPRLPAAPAVMQAPLDAAARPWATINNPAVAAGEQVARARRNPALFFRRALKITNGANLVAIPGFGGLTIASENPVYLQGNWNANGTFAGAHIASAILADAVTLLSGNWNDRASFVNGLNMAARTAVTTWYRLAVLSGKGISFPQPPATPQDFGTDGGAHNFLRYIENWANQTLNYRGSIVSLYRSRQATGVYKCCTTVYSPPTRGYNFDTDFLTPALLPPRTPMFRDVNTTGFAQIIRAQ